MFVPFLSDSRRSSRLSKRRGGGKSGGGAKGGSSTSNGSSGKSGSSTSSGKGTTGSSSSSSSSKSGSSASKAPSGVISSGGSSRSITSYGNGGGKAITIPPSGLFGGRSAGGATRNQIYGSRAYGSGYPGVYSRGVGGRGFPFFFWPLAWGTGIGYGSNAAYLHSDEYGQPDNSSRPGGPMASAAFQSNSTAGTTFRLVADNATVTALMSAVAANCSASLTPASINATLPTPFNATQRPEQVVQYYRASSVALSLDGYNNTAVFAPENSTADTPLPASTDMTLLACLNATIGNAVPLVDGARARAAPSVGSLALVLVLLRALM
ncbi:hypothetical protein C8R44DRAFT_948484 [Mycena epipterygia]|nr:hypothetical protein C8R44DRAFT_948484 [Mycena epipterygia]